MIQIESHISRIEAIDVESQTAPSEVLAAVAAFNVDVTDDAIGGVRTGAIFDIPDKLQEWLDTLLAKVRSIVSKLSDVASFNITVGTPFTVSVSITFARTHSD